MRKILTIALVALMAASLFAGVKTSGYVQGSARLLVPDGGDVSFIADDDSNQGKVSITDENKVWGTTITAQSNRFMTNTWLDVMKVAKSENDIAVKVGFITRDRYATLSAWNANADLNNRWRVRFNDRGEAVYGEVGYQKLVKVNAGFQMYNGVMTEDAREDKMSFLVSALVTPVDGVKVSGGFLSKYMGANNDDTAFVVASDIDVAKLAKLDCTIAAGVAYSKWDSADDGDVVAQVYGEYDGIGAYAEMTMLDHSELKVGATYAFNDKLDTHAYVQFADYEDIDFEQNVKIGGDFTYKLNKQISFYAEGGWAAKDIDAEVRIKVAF
ncbi:MAG: hypothetical protein IJ831_01895 [Spirochaetales bacterium]|nr:hypothetical protein [Spirochaetales bacterium]